MAIPSDTPHLMRELERTVSSLLGLYPDDREFWHAFSMATMTFFDGLDQAEKSWLHERIDAALAVHGVVGTGAVMCNSSSFSAVTAASFQTMRPLGEKA